MEDEYFQAIFKLGPVEGPVRGPVGLPELHILILNECKTMPKSRDEILSGLKIGVSGHIKRVLKQLIEKEYIDRE